MVKMLSNWQRRLKTWLNLLRTTTRHPCSTHHSTSVHLNLMWLIILNFGDDFQKFWNLNQSPLQEEQFLFKRRLNLQVHSLPNIEAVHFCHSPVDLVCLTKVPGWSLWSRKSRMVIFKALRTLLEFQVHG